MQLSLFTDVPVPEPPAFVALDLETTGLNPDTDKIIEVGAVRFTDSQVLTMNVDDCGLQALVNPGVDLTLKITALTGITEDTLDNQPAWDDIKASVQSFLDPPVKYLIAHNIRFEQAFLTAHGLKLDHLTLLDTQDMVYMGMPEAPSSSLATATHILSIAPRISHRAAHDALATGQLFMHLWQRFRQMPDAAIQQVLAHAPVAWPYHDLFQLIAAERSLPLTDTHTPVTAHQVGTAPVPHHAPEPSNRPDQSPRTPIPAAAGWLERLLQSDNGTVASLPCDAASSRDLARECVRWAARNNRHVLLCLPSLHEVSCPGYILQHLQAFAREWAPSLRIACGQNPQHLCDLARLNTWKAGRNLNPTEVSFLTRILYWCSTSPPGHRPFSGWHPGAYGAGRVLWPLVAGTVTSDPAQLVPAHDSGLPAVDTAPAGSITLIDHDTWLMHLDADTDFLRQFDTWVVDDIWNLFQQIPEMCTHTGTLEIFTYLIQQLNRLTGCEEADTADIGLSHLALCPDLVAALATNLETLAPTLQRFMEFLQPLAKDCLDRNRQRKWVPCAVAQMSASRHWDAMLQAWHALKAQGDTLLVHLDALVQALSTEEDNENNYVKQIADWRHACHRVLAHLDQMLADRVHPQSGETVKWMTLRRETERIEFNSSWLWTRERLQHQMHESFTRVLFLHRGQQRLRSHGLLSRYLDLTSCQHLPAPVPAVPAPELQTVIPDNPHDPNSETYLPWVSNQVAAIVQPVQGCVLVLFARMPELKQVSGDLQQSLSISDTQLLVQGLDPWATVAAGLHQPGHTVVCCTYHLLQRIALHTVNVQCAILTRLPFPPPSDPIRARQFLQAQPPTGLYNAFEDCTVPQVGYTLLRIIDQLITPSSPRGQLIVLDPRIRKNYLQQVTKLWRKADRQYPAAERVVQTVRDWHDAAPAP